MEAEQAADVLYRNASAAELDPADLEALQAFCEGASLHDGLDLQLAVLDRWLADGATLDGWKAGLTSLASRDKMGPGFRPFGYAIRVLDSGAQIPLSTVRAPKVETEICLVLGSDLSGPGLTADDARAAVVAVAPSFEITEQRFPPPLVGAFNLANDLGQWAIVAGDGVSPDLDLRSLTVRLERDGEVVDEGGAGDDVVDDPYLSLARIANELGARGRSVGAGQKVITGALLRFPPVEGPGTWTATFDGLGTVSATFT